MLKPKDRGRRKTRRSLILLIGAVVLLADMIWAARAHLEHRRYAQELARKAAETATKREAESAANLDKARQEMPLDVPIPRDWTIQRVDETLKPLDKTDLALLTKLVRALLAREADTREKHYEAARTHASGALSQNSATELERAIAAHIDSEAEVVHVAHAYLAAFRPLREAEQALDRHVFRPQNDEQTMTARLLGNLAALRGLGELQTGDARKAMESTLHAYGFYHAALSTDLAAFGYYSHDTHCARVDWLLEQIVDQLWKQAPLGDDDRERVLEAVGGRPSKEELVEDFYSFAATDPTKAFGPLDASGYLAYVPQFVMAPVRTRGANELVGRIAPLLGQPGYEHEAEWKGIGEQLPRWADATASIWDVAQFANDAWCARGTRAELTRAAFRLKDYRRDHGQYPEHPAEPLPRVPSTGKSYEYVRTEKGFVFKYDSERTKKTEIAWEAKE